MFPARGRGDAVVRWVGMCTARLVAGRSGSVSEAALATIQAAEAIGAVAALMEPETVGPLKR
jgi:hypothetical protein